MAVATPPTIDTLTVEALKQAGYPNAAAGDTYQVRAEIWLQECLGEIWHQGNGKFKSLMTADLKGIRTTAGTSNDEGKGIWDNPTNHAYTLGMSLLEGKHYGVMQNGTDGNTVKLASDEDLSSADAIGKELVVFLTATPTTCESAFIRNFNTTTKVAKLHSTLSYSDLSSAGANYSYLVVDTVKKLNEGNVWGYDEINGGQSRGEPQTYHSILDGDVNISTIVEGGQFYLEPIPYWNSDGKLRALRHKYYANLMKLDIDDSAVTKIFAKLLTNWRAELTQYIKYKALNSNKDPREASEKKTWEAMKSRLIAIESYGHDLSNMEMTVED